MTAAPLDPRLHAYRDDLAAARLRGRVSSPRFVEGERRQVVAASAPLRRAPRFDAPLDTEALFGETVMVYEEREGWAWSQLERDAYVGYLPADALSSAISPVTHRVSALRTYVYPAPDIKTPPLMLLSLNAALAAEETGGDFLRLADGGFVHGAHARPQDVREPDFVAVAARFLGTPYLWGGRTSIGVDCSGLVQLALEATGRALPRDTDMQQDAIGTTTTEETRLTRGDLVFWPGHVGIMADAKTLIHANAHHMKTTLEPLDQVAARNAAPIACIGRL